MTLQTEAQRGVSQYPCFFSEKCGDKYSVPVFQRHPLMRLNHLLLNSSSAGGCELRWL